MELKNRIKKISYADATILITKMLVEKYNLRCNKYIHTIDKELIEIFKTYSWPGNLRELENLVEFMVSLSGENGIIEKSMLPISFIQSYNEEITNKSDEIYPDDDIIKLKEIEKRYIKKALNKYGNSTEGKIKAAKKLGMITWSIKGREAFDIKNQNNYFDFWHGNC